jgi:hypothetical protein
MALKQQAHQLRFLPIASHFLGVLNLPAMISRESLKRKVSVSAWTATAFAYDNIFVERLFKIG